MTTGSADMNELASRGGRGEGSHDLTTGVFPSIGVFAAGRVSRKHSGGRELRYDPQAILLIALVLLHGVVGLALVVAGGLLGRRAFVARWGGPAGHAGVAGHRARRAARWRRRHRICGLGAAARDRDRRPARRLRHRDGADRFGDRPCSVGLLVVLLRADGSRRTIRRYCRQHGPPRWPADPVRRRDARHRRRRRSDHDVHGVGADLDHVVSADRRPAQSPRGSRRRIARLAHHVGRGSRAACRHRPHRRCRRNVPDVGDPRRSAVRDGGHRRSGLCGDRSVHEVGAVPVSLVVAGSDGRADPGECLLALGDDGQGRRLPARTLRAGVRSRRAVAGARARRWARHDDRRRPARPAPARSQAALGVRHGQPARVPRRLVRCRNHRRDAGRHRPADRPRPVQGDGVHGGRDRRSSGGHA